MPAHLSASFFGFPGILLGIALPLAILQILSLIFIAGLLRNASSVRGIGKAIYCYLLQGVGLFLMTIGGLPTVYSVLAGLPLSLQTYFALLAVFAVGGLTYLWHDHLVQQVDASSRAVPFNLYFYTVKLLGTLAVIIPSLLLLTKLILRSGMSPATWWVMPAVMLVYGLLLSWSTRLTSPQEKETFFSSPLSASALNTAERKGKRGKK